MKTSEQTPEENEGISEMVHFQSFADKQTLAQLLAAEVALRLRDGIATKGKASLVVSGGSTPKPFFEALQGQELDWESVYITLADERWVDPKDPDSNELLVREHLLPDGAHFVGLKSHAPDPASGCTETEAALKDVPQPFDVVVLGMGDDGHTASLFPHAPELREALAPVNNLLCHAITPPSYAPHPRITLTLPALLNANRIILHITGQAKHDVFVKASAAGPVEDMPIRAILRQEQTPVDVYWAA